MSILIGLAHEPVFNAAMTTQVVFRGALSGGWVRMSHPLRSLLADGDLARAAVSLAADAGLEFDQQILSVRAPTDRWMKELMWIPGFLLFGLVVLLQRRRKLAQTA